MTGSRLERALRGLLHADTFELFVAPAIADLQYAPSLAGYAAVWTTVCAALIRDAHGDLEALVDELGLVATLIVIQSCYYGGLLLVLVAHLSHDEAMARLSGGGGSFVGAVALGVVVASAVPTLFCCWPPRRAPHP